MNQTACFSNHVDRITTVHKDWIAKSILANADASGLFVSKRPATRRIDLSSCGKLWNTSEYNRNYLMTRFAFSTSPTIGICQPRNRLPCKSALQPRKFYPPAKAWRSLADSSAGQPNQQLALPSYYFVGMESQSMVSTPASRKRAVERPARRTNTSSAAHGL